MNETASARAQADLDTLCINTIRTLAMDAVQAGELRPSGDADGAWRRSPTCSGSAISRFDPDDPIWPNRDRFVLSAGHASMLLYSHAAPDRRARP